ncbi:MAG TPA: helix-turn-helix transcriptional regulator [Blastocatellia bacterium]|nr:helix-turn-helix transcriptional regulator [Blastocatellia bacterium]
MRSLQIAAIVRQRLTKIKHSQTEKEYADAVLMATLPDNSVEMRFSQWLLAVMMRADIRQSELARRSGLSKQYINGLLAPAQGRIGTRYYRPSEEACEKLARALGENPDDALVAADYSPRRHEMNKGREEDKGWFDAMFYLDKNLPPGAKRERIEYLKELLEKEYREQYKS